MNANSALGRGARRPVLSARLLLAAAAAAFVVAAAAGVLLGAGGTGPGTHAPRAAGRLSTTSPAHFQRLLQARLSHLGLNYHWVACVPSGRVFGAVRVVRCNVDFGEPHIEAYCSVLRNRRLLTSQEDPAIPCAHDNSGMYTPVVTYN